MGSTWAGRGVCPDCSAASRGTGRDAESACYRRLTTDINVAIGSPDRLTTATQTRRSRAVPQRRENPYIRATWLPRRLTGENSCEWAIWFEARYVEWTRQPSAFD